MNPVRTLGPAIAAGNYKGIWIYLLAPIIGALCGAAAYTVVRLKGEDNQGRPTRSFRISGILEYMAVELEQGGAKKITLGRHVELHEEQLPTAAMTRQGCHTYVKP